jgi:hypothetical protein
MCGLLVIFQLFVHNAQQVRLLDEIPTPLHIEIVERV